MSWWAASLSLFLGAASAKEPKVYVNGERADGLRDVVLEDVAIRFDERGNLWITAPQYRVGGAVGASAHEPAAAGQWWLVVEDLSSSDLSITVTINGRVATTVRSGQGGGTLDVGPWLHRGANQIVLSAPSSESVQGGPLVVKIGEGKQAVDLDSVAVSFARDPATASAKVERSFVLRVP
jgi:hypothetical protein